MVRFWNPIFLVRVVKKYKELVCYSGHKQLYYSLGLLSSLARPILVIGMPHCENSNSIKPNLLGSYLIPTWIA